MARSKTAKPQRFLTIMAGAFVFLGVMACVGGVVLAARGVDEAFDGAYVFFLGLTEIAVGKTINLVVRRGHEVQMLKNRIERLEGKREAD